MAADSSPKASDRKVFVSYVREDQDAVDRLAKELSAYGIKVWLDKTDLKPGHRWKDTIREAISEGDFFIACFSEAYQRRSKSYMNEELTLAIEELRQRPTERAWFIPVLLSECQVPARSIGAGETLRDIQWVALHHNWEQGIATIATACDPDAQNAKPPRVWQLDDQEWSSLVGGLRRGGCFVPILGRGVNCGVVPVDETLARKWAREFERPEWIDLPFSKVAEHLAQTRSYYYLEQSLLNEYASARSPEFNVEGEPHGVLSQLPCKVFITACIDSFMEDALVSRGKRPRSVTLSLGHIQERWEGVSKERFEPTVSEPLVVHVFGHLDVPNSVVVTEDHQIRLLRAGVEILPMSARKVLGEHRHIWLGFDTDTTEYSVMSSLVETSNLRVHEPLFNRNFEIRAVREGRRRILLRDFMAMLQSRWEQENRKDGSS